MITYKRCKEHPSYQAKRYPRSECPRCLEIWEQEEFFRANPIKASVYLDIADQRPDWAAEEANGG
jgi:hypothetical protein